MRLPLSDRAQQWLEDKGVGVELAAERGLYTASVKEDGSIEPDVEGDTLAIPFHVDGRPVGFQYRRVDDYGRNEFKHVGQKTFYNFDAIKRAIDEKLGLCIVGSPIDALACETSGMSSVIAVPDGPIADNAPKHEDPDKDAAFAWMRDVLPDLKKIRRIVLALGASGGSERMRDEIARRVGRARCARAVLPPDVRDIGDLAAKRDQERSPMAIAQKAVPIPVSGLYKMKDYVSADRDYLSVGFRALEGIFRLYRGAFVVVSGLPGAGKSLVANQIAFNMMLYHNWNVAFATFEEDPDPDLARKLRHFFLEKPRNTWSDPDIAEADAFIDKHCGFITRDPTGNDDDDITIDWLCARIEDAVIRWNISMCIIDPWNEIDHRKLPGEQRDEYVNRALRKLKDTGKRLDVCLVVVAHPTKEAHKDKDNRPMGLADISDGASWANKAEIGLIVYRMSHSDSVTEVHVKKIKFRGSGLAMRKGTLYFEEELEKFGG